MANAVLPFVYVGLGGFIGAALRYGATLLTSGSTLTLPWGTLISNLVGCFAIGMLAAFASEIEAVSPEARLFLATGLCGGFTTMSSFIYELAQYLRSGEILLGSVYFGATLVGAMLLFYLGSSLVLLLRNL